MNKSTFWAATYLVAAAISLVTMQAFNHSLIPTMFFLLTSTIWQAAEYIKNTKENNNG